MTHRLKFRRIPWHTPEHLMLAAINRVFIAAQTSPSKTALVIELTNRRRTTLRDAITTPCTPSRNKREGRYTGRYKWADVTGWGMAAYFQHGHNRSRVVGRWAAP